MRQPTSLVALCCLFFSSPLHAGEYSYSQIKLPGSGETWATDINARGTIIGIGFDAEGAPRSFLLRNGVFTEIKHPRADLLEARGINARGDVSGIFFDSTGAGHGFLRSDGRFTVIDVPDASFTFVYGLNNAGEVAAHSDVGDFIFKNGKFRAAPGYTRDLQDNGRVFVGVTEAPEGGFVGFVSRRPDEMEFVVHPDQSAPCSVVRGINQRGDLVGGLAYINAGDECTPLLGDAHGFLLRNGEFTQIDFPGAVATEAWAINDDGVIVGRYVDRRGRTWGFRARPKD